MLSWQNWQDDSADGLSLGDVKVAPVSVDTNTARTDLTIALAERWSETGEPAGISGGVEFRTDVFDVGSVEVLVGRLRRVLEGMVADPGRRLSSVGVVDEVEWGCLEGWGNRSVLTRPVGAAVSIPGVVC